MVKIQIYMTFSPHMVKIFTTCGENLGLPDIFTTDLHIFTTCGENSDLHDIFSPHMVKIFMCGENSDLHNIFTTRGENFHHMW